MRRLSQRSTGVGPLGRSVPSSATPGDLETVSLAVIAVNCRRIPRQPNAAVARLCIAKSISQILNVPCSHSHGWVGIAADIPPRAMPKPSLELIGIGIGRPGELKCEGVA